MTRDGATLVQPSPPRPSPPVPLSPDSEPDAVVELPPSAAPRRTIGRYELRRVIGRGAMGVVYEARDPLLDRMLAVKMIQIAFATSLEEFAIYQQRFLVEARTAARLSHPGIVVVHDVGQDASTGDLYIAMEHLDGRTLAEVLRSGVALPWREALRLTARVAEALHYAHARGVVHRDVKPANVMLLASGEPKIMDFGIAQSEAGRARLTSAGQSIGTPLYGSPEQLLGLPVDCRSDVFSLGAMAYSMLTGRDAFAADNLAAVVTRVVDSEPAPPSSLVPGLPPDVDRVVARALAKDPKARYPDGAALARDVGDLLAGSPARDADSCILALDTLPRPHRASLPLDVEAELAALVTPPRQEQPAVAPRPAPRRPPRWLGLALVGAGVLAALVAARSLAFSRGEASPPPAALAAGETTARPANPPPAELGGLSIRLQGLPRDAAVRVWVDRAPVAGLSWVDPKHSPRLLRFGATGAAVLALAVGGHDVEVEVAWDGKRYGSRIWGDIRPGATRRLRGKLGGLLKKHLSLDWE